MFDSRRCKAATTTMFVILMAAGALVAVSRSGAAAERQTIGYIEDILLFPGSIPFKAKIDSGANTSSLDVADIQEFERDGKPWVRFQLVMEDGRWVGFDSPVVRVSTVRRAGTDAERRPVVRFGICLGRHFKMADVNLYDRTDMNHRMLIGRRFLGKTFLIDASAKNLTKPDCPGAPRQ